MRPRPVVPEEFRHENLPLKTVFGISDLNASMDQIIKYHGRPMVNLQEEDELDAEYREQAVAMALERPVAQQPIPGATGDGWTPDDWTEKAIQCADDYIRKEGMEPVVFCWKGMFFCRMFSLGVIWCSGTSCPLSYRVRGLVVVLI